MPPAAPWTTLWRLLVPPQVLNYSADGFSSMMYWLEIQDMALRLAGGTPGPEAEAAANWLIQRLPHTFVIARCD